MFYDAAIAGGGPAGSAAGLALKQLAPGARIALFGASGYDRWRHGEILSGQAREILERLDCWTQSEGTGMLPCHGNRAAWGSAEPYDNEFIFSMHGNSWRLDRRRFDETLCGCAQAAGVDGQLHLDRSAGGRLVVFVHGSRRARGSGVGERHGSHPPERVVVL